MLISQGTSFFASYSKTIAQTAAVVPIKRLYLEIGSVGLQAVVVVACLSPLTVTKRSWITVCYRSTIANVVSSTFSKDCLFIASGTLRASVDCGCRADIGGV